MLFYYHAFDSKNCRNLSNEQSWRVIFIFSIIDAFSLSRTINGLLN